MFYDALENAHGLRFDPFKALVAPRPIGWISSLSRNGIVNLAPYSYFNAVADKPPVVMFSGDGRKDSQRNAEETGEFVCNLATWALREKMNMSSTPVDAGTDEMALAGLETAACEMVRPPRVKASPAALECRYIKTVDLPDGSGGRHAYAVVFGLVVGVHINDSVIADGMVDIAKIKPIARLGYHDYAVVKDAFTMEWKA